MRLIIAFVYVIVLFASAAFGIAGIADGGNSYVGSLSLIPVLVSFILVLTFWKWNRTRFGRATFMLVSTCSYVAGMFVVNRVPMFRTNIVAILVMLTLCTLIPFIFQRFVFRGFSAVDLRGYEDIDGSSMAKCCIIDGQRVWVACPRHLPMKYDDIRIEGLVNSIHSGDDPLLLIVLGASSDGVDGVHYMQGRSSRRKWVEFEDIDSCRWWIKDNKDVLAH